MLSKMTNGHDDDADDDVDGDDDDDGSMVVSNKNHSVSDCYTTISSRR